MSLPPQQIDPQRPAALETHLLGCVDFDSALLLQQWLAKQVAERSDTQGTLLICEHPLTVTLGREGSRAHLPHEPEELKRRRIDVRWLNRGGSTVLHAPGQLAVYPIVPLDRLGLGLADYRHRLEQAVIKACAEMQVPAHRRDEESGLWCRGGQFAMMGVAVRSWVAHHGLFINVNPDMELMRLVRMNTCHERVTSLAAERLQPTSMSRFRESLIRHLVNELGYERHHLYTGHPFLKRTRRRVYAHS